MSQLWLLYLREMRTTLRERNVLLYVLVVPLLLYPFLLWLAMSTASLLSAEEERSPLKVALRPAEPALARSLARHQITVVDSQNPEQDLRDARVDAVVEIDKLDKIRIFFDGRFRQGARAHSRIRPLMARYRDVRIESLALANGARLEDLQPYYFDSSDESNANDLGRYVLGTFLPLTLLVVLSLGSLYPAVETFAGEHERQTVDTTLMLAVSRWQIIASKYLLVVSLCCLSGCCNLLAVTVSLRAILQPLDAVIAERVQWGWSLSSLSTIGLGIVVMSMLVGAATLIFTAHTRTFRQGQAATTPLFLAILIPTGALVDRSMTLDVSTCWVPVVNIALLWRDSLTSRVSPGVALATVVCSLAWVMVCLGLLSWRLRIQSRGLGLLDGRPTAKS